MYVRHDHEHCLERRLHARLRLNGLGAGGRALIRTRVCINVLLESGGVLFFLVHFSKKLDLTSFSFNGLLQPGRGTAL